MEYLSLPLWLQTIISHRPCPRPFCSGFTACTLLPLQEIDLAYLLLDNESWHMYFPPLLLWLLGPETFTPNSASILFLFNSSSDLFFFNIILKHQVSLDLLSCEHVLRLERVSQFLYLQFCGGNL